MKMLVLLLATAAALPGQSFEVASIRPAKQDGHRDSDFEKSLYITHNLTLKRLIAQGYSVDAGQISGGPGWIDTDSYDITAKVPVELSRQAHVPLPAMIQSLLAERFQLVVHREPRQVSGYALVVAKKGPKMQRATGDEKDAGTSQHNTHLTARNLTMEAFARDLSRDRDIGALVVDKTGLSGAFNFELDWAPEGLQSKTDATADDRPSIFTALQERLGLKLEAAKVPILAVVVDRAEKPEGN